VTDRPKLLQVSMHGDVIADLREKPRSRRIELTYTDLACARWPARTPVVSCSLPVMASGQDATPFLNGLLPEGQTRATLAAQRDLVASDTWGLLAAYGRDIAGALVISDPEDDRAGRPPRAVGYASEDELASSISALPDHPLGAYDDSELSLAGMQEKLLLVASDSPTGWGRPVAGLPSTHILKPDPLAHPGVVVREAEALQIAARAGLTTIDPQVQEIGGRSCLIVSRYDRTVDGADVRRIHQEDLLQAVGLDPADRHGRVKYQEHGGPGYRDVAAILLERATSPDAQLDALVGAMVFTVLIGNADAHAKNLSLLLDPPTTVRLAPLYDTVPTVLFPNLKVRCAMWVGGVHRSLEDVTRADLVREIAGRRAWKIPEGDAPDLIDRWVGTIAAHADDTPTGQYVASRAKKLMGSEG
jgi:serine/threonine-protein kinase HipA